MAFSSSSTSAAALHSPPELSVPNLSVSHHFIRKRRKTIGRGGAYPQDTRLFRACPDGPITYGPLMKRRILGSGPIVFPTHYPLCFSPLGPLSLSAALRRRAAIDRHGKLVFFLYWFHNSIPLRLLPTSLDLPSAASFHMWKRLTVTWCDKVYGGRAYLWSRLRCLSG